MNLPRSLFLSSLLALSALGPAGCSSSAPAPSSASTQPVTDVPQGTVRDQSIGNCWIYATSSWIESLAKTATGSDLAVSESYMTYWHWFEQIVGRRASSISTGGSWRTAVGLVARYGMMTGGDFLPEDATSIYSTRQETALNAINAALKDGALKDTAARADRAKVRAELDKAWGLSPEVSKMLDAAFGADVSQTLDAVDTSRTKIVQAKDVAVAWIDQTSKAKQTATLADMFGDGASAWGEVDYPGDAQGRRDLEKRVQRALNDHQPVVLSWLVDFNALDADGRFAAPPTKPGRQGGHMVVMEDYEVENVPGFGTLKAGVTETRPEALDAALADDARIVFFRVKNSWGDYHSAKDYSQKGYHDLYAKYLDGPVKQCQVDANDNPNTDSCWDATPFWSVVLPAGY